LLYDDIVPAEVQASPQKTRSISKKKKRQVKLTTNNVDRFQEKMYLENLAPLVETGYKQLLLKMKRGDMKALDIGLQIANLYKPRTGQVNVVTQIYNKNGGDPSGSDKVQSVESILRRLEESESATANASAKEAVIDVRAS